jgi:hypothetical protein
VMHGRHTLSAAPTVEAQSVPRAAMNCAR